METDEGIIDLLRSRDGVATKVGLRNGAVCEVFDIAWGYDDGDPFAHVSTNVSPGRAGASFDVFSTSEVEMIVDPVTHETLYSALDRPTGTQSG